MKEHDFQEEVMKILQEAPSARRALLENHDNLLSVSEYCANNYMQVSASTFYAKLYWQFPIVPSDCAKLG